MVQFLEMAIVPFNQALFGAKLQTIIANGKGMKVSQKLNLNEYVYSKLVSLC